MNTKLNPSAYESLQSKQGIILHYYSTNCYYAHIWSGSPQYLSSVHDRYPAIRVNDHIWKCTADLLSRFVRAAILKSERVLAVFPQI